MSEDDRSRSGNVISLFGGARPPTLSPAAPARAELRRVAQAPQTEDPRQDLGRRTLGKGTAQLGRRGSSVMYNLATGMAASAVNLGKLQSLLEGVICELEMPELSERWDDEVRGALQDAVLEWVQRVDAFELEVHDSGVSISLQTQDDYGFYQYGFDVFPGRPADG
ncbi:MAG TPA: hypothetical protein DFR83_03370 [Deltaproteobacteria bacterium]|nr:hypothetical protein [Deltaproteobacteria bacterium]